MLLDSVLNCQLNDSVSLTDEGILAVTRASLVGLLDTSISMTSFFYFNLLDVVLSPIKHSDRLDILERVHRRAGLPSGGALRSREEV